MPDPTEAEIRAVFESRLDAPVDDYVWQELWRKRRDKYSAVFSAERAAAAVLKAHYCHRSEKAGPGD